MTTEMRFWAKVERGQECWIWTGARRKGRFQYGRFLLDGKARLAHRIAWQLTNGPIPDGMCVLHRCDNPPCVNPEHLFLGTHADNMLDCSAKGRLPAAQGVPYLRGERHPNHKLTADDVRAIRASRASSPDIAAQYGLHRGTVHDIRTRRAWRHVV